MTRFEDIPMYGRFRMVPTDPEATWMEHIVFQRVGASRARYHTCSEAAPLWARLAASENTKISIPADRLVIPEAL